MRIEDRMGNAGSPGGLHMSRCLILAIIAGSSATFAITAQTEAVSPQWQLVDSFSTPPNLVLGTPNWSQPTPNLNLDSNGSQAKVNPTTARGLAVCTSYTGDSNGQRIRFKAYSGDNAGYASAVIGYKDYQDYYEVRLNVSPGGTGNFDKILFYHVQNGIPNLDNFAGFQSPIDALKLDVSLSGTTATASIQPIDPITGADQGSPLAPYFDYEIAGGNVPNTRFGFAGTGPVRFDDFETYIVPEPGAVIMLALAFLPLLRPERRLSRVG
jgi:hypothetical protein